jgi:hypothetical protein
VPRLKKKRKRKGKKERETTYLYKKRVERKIREGAK